MEDRCISVEDLDTLLDLSSGDPRLRHLNTCSACRTLLASYQQFLNNEAPPANSRPEEAHRDLSSFLKNWVSEVEMAQVDRPFLSSLVDFLRGPVMVPALALTLLLIATTFFLTTRDGESPKAVSGVLRGGPDSESTAIIVEAKVMAHDGIRLAWQPVTDAVNYKVFLLGEDLGELIEIDALSANHYDFNSNALLSETGSNARFWRVIAISGGEEIARSELLALPRYP